MNLYKGGYGKYQFYTVAKAEKEAIENIQNKYNMKPFPITVKKIDDIDGYKILAEKSKAVSNNANQKTKQRADNGTRPAKRS